MAYSKNLKVDNNRNKMLLITTFYSLDINKYISAYEMTWIKVAAKEEINNGKGKELNVNGTRIALFNANGKYYAVEALCRHQDGSLAPGRIDGEIVECPLHSWHYNIRTGQLLDYLEGVELTTYDVDAKGNDIYVDV
ncbi:MAG: Rieske 2Fe-2S domain-containing protein [Candidatus Nitrosopolaris sp.]